MVRPVTAFRVDPVLACGSGSIFALLTGVSNSPETPASVSFQNRFHCCYCSVTFVVVWEDYVRSKVGAVLAFLGAFLVVVALLAQFYATGQLKKTPLDVDTVTHLGGTAVLSGESSEVKTTSTTHSNSDKSTDSVIVWQNSSCTVKDLPDTPDCVSADDPQNRLISASVDDFATDRVSGLAVNEPDLLPADAVPHEGLVNKWPFDSEKKTYPYWDGDAGEAVDAVYDRTEDLLGIECYVYKVTMTDVPIEIAEGVPGTVSKTMEIYVEPLTGAIQNQVVHQEQVLEDGTPVVTVDVQFTDAQLKDSADDADKNRGRLLLLTRTVPLVGYLVGIPVLIIGLLLSFLARRRPAQPAPQHAVTNEKTDVGA